MNATTTTIGAAATTAAATTAAAATATARTTATTTIRSVAELDHHGTWSHEVYTAGFYPGSWDYVVRLLLGKGYRGGADPGEVLATIAAVAPEDRAGWFAAWTALGDRLTAVADTCAARGHQVSAARTYLRAANYLGVALNSIDGLDTTDPLLPTFRAHRAAWENFVDQTHWPVQRVDIPYQDTSMPGWLFRPDASTEVRPTLVANNGSDGTTSGLWCHSVEAGLERGYNVLLFDGPGQQSLLYERNISFRYDWEKVLTPVVDFLLARDDVDADRLAVLGISQAGYWVPRALAFERRFAAAIADGGVVDISRTWFANLPPVLLSLYREGKTDHFDQAMTAANDRPGGTGRPGDLAVPGPTLRRHRILRRSRRRLAIQPDRRRRADPHPAVHHRPRRRAALTRPICRTRPARPRLDPRLLHRRRRRHLSLPTNGSRPHRAAHVRLAGRTAEVIRRSTADLKKFPSASRRRPVAACPANSGC